MDSYYDGLIRQVKELMDDSRHAEAFDLLKEELSMPYIPKVYEEEIITLYNACRSELKLQNNSTRRTADDIDALLKGSVDEQFQAVEQLKSSNIRNHLTEVQHALDSDANEWVKVFLIEALCEQNVSEEFFMERDGLRYAFVPCSLTLPRDGEVIYECVSQLRAWFENEDPSFLSLCVETLMQEAYLRLPMDIDEAESLLLSAAVVGYVFEAYEMPQAFDAFLKEKNLALDMDYELLLKKHDCSLR